MKKTAATAIFIIIFILSGFINTFAGFGATAKRATPSLYVNGEPAYCTGFNIEGYNYFRLRDIARELSGTTSRFDVEWNSEAGQVEIITGKDYVAEENTIKYSDRNYIAYPTTAPILVNGSPADIEAYNIDGYNYFKLRDLGEVIPFYVDWVEAQASIYITTQLLPGTYKAEAGSQLPGNSVSGCSRPWPGMQNSYLTQNADGTINTIDIGGSIAIDTYDSSFKRVSARDMAFELPIFGTFYSGKSYNYIAYGQDNTKQSDSKEVIRIVKYDKAFHRLGSVSIKGGESFTISPFTASGGRMAEDGNRLIFHTARTRYKTSDGLNHQSQLTVIVDTDSMKVLNSLGEYQPNHVSHSFNQFVAFDGEKHVLLDHGDAYPRSVVLHRQSGENEYSELELFKISGKKGDNYTGVSVGGFQVTSGYYIAAVNSIDQSKMGTAIYNEKSGLTVDERDVYLCVAPALNTASSNVRKIKLTQYAGTGRTASAPKLVRISGNRLVVLWQEIIREKGNDTGFAYGPLKYLVIDGSGKASGKIKGMDNFILSSCDPIVYGDRLVWYVNQGASRIFYTIEVD